MEADQPEEDKMEKKITQLLLSTPGACFLCLQDNETNYGGGVDGGIVDLSNICRYLNIDQCSLLLTSLKNDGGSSVDQGQCAFSVNLCLKCLQLTGKLNDMIIQLERAKLMVNFHLQLFHKTLEGTEYNWEESLEWINLLGRMYANSSNSFESKLVELLRKETKDKSLKILKKAEAAKPQVILPKLTAPPSTSFEIPPAFDTSKSTRTSIKTLLSQLVTSSVIPSKKSRKSKLYRCPYCAKVMTISKISIHLACQHSDKVLSLAYPSSNPPTESICREVFQTQVIAKAQKIPSKSSSASSPRLGCHLCGITYSDSTLIKQHFLISHTDKLCEEINNFAKNSQKLTAKTIKVKKTPSNNPPPPKAEAPNPIENLIKNFLDSSLIIPSNQDDKDVNSSTKVIRRRQCPFCEVSTDHFRFARHLANNHPDKLLASFITTIPSLDKLKNDKPDHFSQICRKVLTMQIAKAVKSSGTTPGGTSSSSVPSKCHLCGKKCSDNRTLKHHLLVNHTDYILEQLIKMQNVKIGRVQGQVNQKKKKVIEKGNTLKQTIDKPKRKMEEKKSCPFCGLSLSNNCKLRRHQVSKHSDELFLKCRPSGMGGEEWRGFCKKFFGGEVKEATRGKAGDKIYRCRYCPKGKTSYRGPVDFEVHLAYQHRREMEERLEEFEKRRNSFGGNLEEDGGEGGGDYQIVVEGEEEDGGEYGMMGLEDIGSLHEMLYPDMVMDEGNDKEDQGAYQEVEDDNLDQLEQQQLVYFEEDGGDHEVDGSEGIGNLMTEEPFELNDNQSEPELAPPLSPIIKMEVNEEAITLNDY